MRGNEDGYSSENKRIEEECRNDPQRIFGAYGHSCSYSGGRTPPEYIPRLIDYQLKYEKLMQEKEVKNAEE